MSFLKRENFDEDAFMQGSDDDLEADQFAKPPAHSAEASALAMEFNSRKDSHIEVNSKTS